MYLVEINGSKAAVRHIKGSDILVEHATSSGLGGGHGADQLCGICSAPYKPLVAAITKDSSELGTVYRFAAGKHGSCNITPLETEQAVQAARKIIRGGRRKKGWR